MITKEQLLEQAGRVRQDAANFLTTEATLYRKLLTQSDEGEIITTYEPPVVIPVRVINRSGTSDRNVAAQGRAVTRERYDGIIRFQVAVDLNISSDDILEYIDESQVLHRYNIIYVPLSHKFMGARVIQCEELL